MNRIKIKQYSGYTVIELLMVMVIIAALASIAVSHYANERENARTAQCLLNRYHIELEEKAFFLEHNRPGLEINDMYKCASGGTYVWLVSDPQKPGYPKVGCSLHYIGYSVPEIDPEEPEPELLETLMALMDHVNQLDLSKGLKNSLLSKLTSAYNALSQNNGSAAQTNLESFISHVRAQTDKGLDRSDADSLISEAGNLSALLE
jgi:prepilin-type N-terminal cleavage/methylation domain-containing protein